MISNLFTAVELILVFFLNHSIILQFNGLKSVFY